MYCDFRDTIFFRANLSHCAFSGSNFTGANMREVTFNGGEGIGVIFENDSPLPFSTDSIANKIDWLYIYDINCTDIFF
jgi:uncharacterized protein YjbI with pentapeptide repeats